MGIPRGLWLLPHLIPRTGREAVVELAAAMELRGVHGGPLANAVAAEALTSVLVGINKRYKADGAGIRITGLDPGPASADT